MSPEPQNVGIIGAGWVGLVTGACLAELGHNVLVRDVDSDRIAALSSGNIPIYEPGLEECVRAVGSRLNFTLDLGELVSEPRILLVCVGTPATYSGDADLTAVHHVVSELGAIGVPDGTMLVMKSTVPVGTGAAVREKLDAQGLQNVSYLSNPEFLAEGTALRDFMKPDRVVVGGDDEASVARVADLYAALDAQIVRTDIASAEMIKLASNAFLATRISFVNEIANVCEATGADVTEVARGMGLDRRLGPHFLRAGIGFGGSCFHKDVNALKQLAGNSGYHFQLLNAVIEVNELQKRRVIGKLEKHLGSLRDKTVALLGLTFKPDTDDMREASSLVLASRLIAEGASVRGWDPVALEQARALLAGVELFDDPLEALEGVDAAVLVTEWPEIRELPFDRVVKLMRTPVLVDGRNYLDPATLRALGFTYEGIGRPGR
ncbi:MAG: UDP-glucose dehydrogenase family protein [Gaiellaceae bacterium]